jgi:hypothetical protein
VSWSGTLAWVWVLVPGAIVGAPSVDPLSKCRAVLARHPSSADGYQCLFRQASAHRSRVGQLLDARVRERPDDPWALLYGGLFHSYGGENVPEAQYARAAQGFRRAGDDRGMVTALVSQTGQRCFTEDRCDDAALRLLEEAERVAEAGDDIHPRRLVQLWWFRWAIKEDDLARGDRALQRLESTPGEDPPWMSAQLRSHRAFVAGVLRALEEKLALYSAMVESSPAGSPQHAAGLGGQASAAAALALRGTFDRSEAEQLLRQAIAAQDRTGLEVSLIDPAAGSLASRVHLALLLGPTAEALALLDEVLAAHQARPGWSYPWYAYWLQARYLSEGQTPRMDRALAAAEAAVARASPSSSAWEHARSLLMRAFVRWRAGQPEPARRDALLALDDLEALRRLQGDDRTCAMRTRWRSPTSWSPALSRRGEGQAWPVEIRGTLEVMEHSRPRASRC